MKKLIMACVAAGIMYVPASYAAVKDASLGVSALKKAEIVKTFDGKAVEKRKRKRKHTGLDDGPNHT